jgi:hypothetical protein
MTVMVKSNKAYTNTNIPIISRDPVIRASTKWCYDVLRAYSWPSQADATDGQEIEDLADVAPAVVEGTLSWNNALSINPGSSTEHIKLPASSKLASDVEAFGVTLWAKFSAFTANRGLIGIGKKPSGSGDFLSTQYIMYINGSEQLSARVNKSLGFGSTPITTDIFHQLGLTLKLVGSSYDSRLWLDGAQVGQLTVAGPMVADTPATEAWIGLVDGVLAGQSFDFVRSVGDSLESWDNVLDFITADWNAGNGRFT